MDSFKGWRTVFAMVLALAGMLTMACNKTDVAVSDPVPSCFDSILNQGEIEVDCGCVCPPCVDKVTAQVNGVFWSSQSVSAAANSNNQLIISASNSSSNISFIHSGPFAPGTYNLSGALFSSNSPNLNYTSTAGTITFIEWCERVPPDYPENTPIEVSGFFSFKAFEISGTGDSVVVNNGKFTFVSY